MLIVCTDHGFLLGEHQWWGKTAMPCWNEIAHTPLFVYDPRFDSQNKTCDGFVQMADLAPTLLEYFNLDIPKDMTGKPLRNLMEKGEILHPYVVFGFHGDEIIVTDGNYLYMNAPEHPEAPYYEYTLMPTHMRARFSVDELMDWEVAEPFDFTKGLKTMKIRCKGSMVGGAKESRSSKLYNLVKDPGQLNEIEDEVVVKKMKQLIAEYMKEIDAPKELYYRYGIEEL